MGEDLDDVDLQNYKGIYFNDDPSRKYQDKETGAHFEFKQMCTRLQTVYIARKKEMQRDKERLGTNKSGISRNEAMTSHTVDEKSNPIKHSSTMRTQGNSHKRVPFTAQENIIESRKGKNQGSSSVYEQHSNQGHYHHNYNRNEGERERHTMSGMKEMNSHHSHSKHQNESISSQVLQQLKEGLKNMQKTHLHDHRNGALNPYDKAKSLAGAVVTINDNVSKRKGNEIPSAGSSKPRGDQQRKRQGEREIPHSYHKSSGSVNMQHCRHPSKGGTKSSMHYYKDELENVHQPIVKEHQNRESIDRHLHSYSHYSELQFKSSKPAQTRAVKHTCVTEPSIPPAEIDSEYNALEYTLGGNKENSELIPDTSL